MMHFDWVTPETEDFMSKGYLLPGETVYSRVADIAEAFGEICASSAKAEKFYDYMSRGFYSLASPVWSNFGRDRGLPISCNGSFIPDSIEGIMDKASEIAVMTKHGAGTSAYLGAIRPRGAIIRTGGTADGPVHFASIIETVVDVVSQGNVRRGNCAVSLDVEHPDIMEFLEMREEGSLVQRLSMGVCISDKWMQDMIDGDADKRAVWARIIKKRFETGYPYILWTDTVNNAAPDVYRDLCMKIHASNLCQEIALSSDEQESFVCNLSSMNLLKYDEWKDTDAVEILTWFLDSVLTEYIHKTDGMKHMDAPNRFARRQRAIGIGTLGWHSYLQSKMIAFESFDAARLNAEIHKQIAERSLKASQKMAYILGEPELLKGYGRRNVTLMAIAPTTSSSFILGQVSPSIEPLASNYYTKNLAKGKFTYRNPYLKQVLASYGKDDEETWMDILDRQGSVQHLDFLSDHEKAVFKTFSEISPKTIIQQAAQRQKFIDQSQSVNLMIDPNASLKEVNELMIEAWKLGVKTLYYQRGANPVHMLSKSLTNCAVCEA